MKSLRSMQCGGMLPRQVEFGVGMNRSTWGGGGEV